MKPTTLVLPPLAVLTLLAPEALRADPSRTVEVEIVDTPSSGAAHVARYAISVVEDRGWFSTFMKDDATQLRLGARIDHPSKGAAQGPMVTVQVHRVGGGELDLEAGRAVAPSKTLVGKVERDGRSEVFVTVR